MRLLLAEDERSLSKAVCAILEMNHYSVDAVYDGEEALDYIDTVAYDGIILDIMMPKKDGITVLREMRKNGNLTPVILLTAKSEIDDKVEGLDSGANDYLTKPFSSKELLARIRAMIRVNSVQSDSVLRYGNIELDSVTFEVRGPEGVRRLSNKEYQVLEMLMRNPNNVISSDTLFEAIWGLDTEVEQNVVWVYISYLRKILKSIGGSMKIVARRNLGYILEE
ncbi:MAG: response regulator transcription factor [Clostridia bacterium]|nr:response regulator transcription factor [Clostridia bacterium]